MSILLAVVMRDCYLYDHITVKLKTITHVVGIGAPKLGLSGKSVERLDILYT